MTPAIRHPHSPCLCASVANASHSFTLRTALRTNGPLITRHPALSGAEGCISNRHPCRLETTLNPCVSTTAPFLIVTQTGEFLVGGLSADRQAPPFGVKGGVLHVAQTILSVLLLLLADGSVCSTLHSNDSLNWTNTFMKICTFARTNHFQRQVAVLTVREDQLFHR